jgi:hypothetical protein
MSPSASLEAAGSKMCGAVILLSATVVSGRKNTQIYIIKWAKKMCSGNCNSQDLVLGEEHKNFHENAI